MTQAPLDFARSAARCFAGYSLILLASVLSGINASWPAAVILAVGATVKLSWELRVPLLSLQSESLVYRGGFLSRTRRYPLSEIRSWEIRASCLILDFFQGIPAQLRLGSLPRDSREQLEQQLALLLPKPPDGERAV
jgi:hypothetical protein